MYNIYYQDIVRAALNSDMFEYGTQGNTTIINTSIKNPTNENNDTVFNMPYVPSPTSSSSCETCISTSTGHNDNLVVQNTKMDNVTTNS